MSIKLDNLSDWSPLSGSITLRAGGDQPRRVRVYLNCMEPTPFFVVGHTAGEDGSVVKSPARFLCTMPAGLETLEFITSGVVEIAPDSDDRVVYWQSTEGEKMWFEGDGETFTTIAERAPRNEALEWVQFQAEQNQKRMEAALRADMANQLAAFKAEYDGSATGVHGGEVAQPAKSGAKPAAKKAAVPGNGKAGAGAGVPAVEPAPAGVEPDGQADGSEEA